MSTVKKDDHTVFVVVEDAIHDTATRARNLRLRYAAQVMAPYQELRNYPKKFDVTAALESIQNLRSEEWRMALPEELLATESEVQRMMDDIRDISNSLSGSCKTMVELTVETTLPLGYLKRTTTNIHRRVLRNYPAETTQL